MRPDREELEALLGRKENFSSTYSLDEEREGVYPIYLDTHGGQAYCGVKIAEFDLRNKLIKLVYAPHKKVVNILPYIVELRKVFDALKVEYIETPSRQEMAQMVMDRAKKENLGEMRKLAKMVLGNQAKK